MADTLQAVKWMLEQSCPLRDAGEWSNPLLSRARIYGAQVLRSDGDFRLHDEVCVTGTRCARGADFPVPIYGFDVAPTFAPLSGEGLQRMCAECPANAAHVAVAGCGGNFYFFPGSTELDQNLRAVAFDLGLMAAIEREFLATRLLWFGLWADSPLTRGAMEVLSPLLSEFRARHLENSRQSDGLRDFVAAVGAALENDLVLHAEFFPPGHTDFGWHSIFAHCPRCKAGAPLHPWKETPSQIMQCEVCDFSFNPAETTRSEQMKRPDSKEQDLLKALGAERYRSFAVGYLIERGIEENSARRSVEDVISPDPKVDARLRLIRESNQRKRDWIRTVLLANLGQSQYRGKNHPLLISSFRFSVAEFEILLERCQQWKIKISSIRHHCDDTSRDKLLVLTERFESNKAAFANLREQGCNGQFSVGVFRVPDEVTETAIVPQNPEQSP